MAAMWRNGAGGRGPGWAIEGALNPTVLRIHVTETLTDRTIVVCPPEEAPAPFDAMTSIEGVRSLDVQRHRVRVNLLPGGGRGEVSRAVAGVLRASWGTAVSLPPDEGPRAFSIAHTGPRLVAESPVMAAQHGDLTLIRAFEVPGVVEAIAGEGLVLVRLGRLFAWDDVEAEVSSALA
jgi:hypothetical protein